MVVIRPLENGDRDFWYSLDRHLPEWEFDNKVRTKRGYVLLDDDVPVGILRYNLFWDQIPFCTLIFIKQDQQGKGYGKRLMDYWERDMKAQGFGMLLTSTQSDEQAQHFYRKLGYKDCGGLVMDIPGYAQPMEIFLYKAIDPKQDERVWRVTFDGSFWQNKGPAGKEVAVQKSFCWENTRWYVPSIYICSQGIVIDLCMEADPQRLKAFIEKWNLLEENDYDIQMQEQIEREHPLNMDVDVQAVLNGETLTGAHGCGLSWIPPECLGPDGPLGAEDDAKQVVEHYELDPSRGWAIHRKADM